MTSKSTPKVGQVFTTIRYHYHLEDLDGGLTCTVAGPAWEMGGVDDTRDIWVGVAERELARLGVARRDAAATRDTGTVTCWVVPLEAGVTWRNCGGAWLPKGAWWT